jgi:hypothetical protein
VGSVGLEPLRQQIAFVHRSHSLVVNCHINDQRSPADVTQRVPPARDVVIIDAVLDHAVNLEDAPDAPTQRYVDQADWLSGRTLMRAGSWVV